MWSQALGPGEWEAWALLPHPHTSIYVQGHNDTDMYKYTQACTHAHKYTHTHKHVPFYRQPLHPGITGRASNRASGRRYLTLHITARVSLHPSPGLAARGAGTGCSRSSKGESRILQLRRHFYPLSLPLCQRCSLSLYPPSLSSFNKRTPELSTWQLSFP